MVEMKYDFYCGLCGIRNKEKDITIINKEYMQNTRNFVIEKISYRFICSSCEIINECEIKHPEYEKRVLQK
jgi:hypothetical protein